MIPREIHGKRYLKALRTPEGFKKTTQEPLIEDVLVNNQMIVYFN